MENYIGFLVISKLKATRRVRVLCTAAVAVGESVVPVRPWAFTLHDAYVTHILLYCARIIMYEMAITIIIIRVMPASALFGCALLTPGVNNR